MANSNRPLSPHLQVYKPQITSVMSIFHRMTGVALGVGTLFLMWWLVSVAAGPEYYAFVAEIAGSIIGRLVLFGFTWALFYHLCNGLRHLYWDAGWGFELESVTRSGWLVIVASVVLTVVAWAIAYGMGS